MKASEFQPRIVAALQGLFGRVNVINEWDSRQDATDIFADLESYAPRPDIAVGPFNRTAEAALQDANRIRQAAEANPFVQQVVRDVEQFQGGACWRNPNPRCLIAIEIEFSGSSKHILGDYLNASKFGLIGVVIGPPDRNTLPRKQKRMMDKIRRVGHFANKLVQVGKATEDFLRNVVAYDTDEFLRLCNRG